MVWSEISNRKKQELKSKKIMRKKLLWKDAVQGVTLRQAQGKLPLDPMKTYLWTERGKDVQ